MNNGMLKFLHKHVITHSNILFSHSLLVPFPSKIFVLKKIHRGTFGSFGWGYFRIGWLLVQDLHWRQFGRCRRDDQIEFDNPDLDDLYFAFLWPWRLGRLPFSIILDRVFLLSSTAGRGWEWVLSCMVSSSINPFPLFSFMVAILVKKKKKC